MASSAQRWVSQLGETFKKLGFLDVYECRQQQKQWQKAGFHDVTLLAMEEMSIRSPDPESSLDIVRQAATKFENHHRGIAISAVAVTVVGRSR